MSELKHHLADAKLADWVVFWGTTLACALGAVILPLAG
jgi:hypothetical protein